MAEIKTALSRAESLGVVPSFNPPISATSLDRPASSHIEPIDRPFTAPKSVDSLETMNLAAEQHQSRTSKERTMTARTSIAGRTSSEPMATTYQLRQTVRDTLTSTTSTTRNPNVYPRTTG